MIAFVVAGGTLETSSCCHIAVLRAVNPLMGAAAT